jgi:hypothetical protein
VPDSIDRPAPDEDDDDAPTRLDRPARVQLHPKLDPRRIPTQRRFAAVRSLAVPPGDLDLPPLSRRDGVRLAWVGAFIAAAYLAILVAVALALR